MKIKWSVFGLAKISIESLGGILFLFIDLFTLNNLVCKLNSHYENSFAIILVEYAWTY